MKMNTTSITTRATLIPQTRKADPAQSKNNAGGFSFTISPEKQFERFLVLGSTAGTYYVDGKKHTEQNLRNLVDLIKNSNLSTADLVGKVVKYSVEGRVIKNETCLAALAVISAYSGHTPSLLPALTSVARTGTDILTFTGYANDLRGWGRSLKRIVSNWYTSKTPEEVAFQAGVKYKNRNGWTQRDVLRKSHAKATTPEMNDVFRYITNGKVDVDSKLPGIILAAEQLKANPTEDFAVSLISSAHFRLPREAVPTELLNSPKVWEALAKNSPIHALIRNLGKITSLNLLKPLSDLEKEVCAKLTNPDNLKRVHPITILFALDTYKQGRGNKGSLIWSPSLKVIDALEKAFFLSFQGVKPSGKKFCVGLDISGSMATSIIANTKISAKEASFYMALVTVKAEENCHVLAFDSANRNAKVDLRTPTPLFDGIRPISMTANTRLADYTDVCGKWVGGRTDCALPMIYAKDNSLEVDCFVIYTDSETWSGNVHPHVALKEYNLKMGRNARLVVVGMTSTNFSIAKQGDPNMLDVVGFDTEAPSLISNFAQGYF